MNSTLNKLSLINHKLLTIGELPASYLVSMTYEEQLLWLCNYLEKTLLPKMNEIITSFNEISENLGTIANEILTEKIANGELIVSLGMNYNESTEALTFSINSETPSEILSELETLTAPSEGE